MSEYKKNKISIEEHNIIKRPDIIDPYKLGRVDSVDLAFVEDLNLSKLLEKIKFRSDKTKALSKEVFLNFNSDVPTAEYRQDIFEELINNPNTRETSKEIAENLFGFNNLLNSSSQEGLETGVYLLTHLTQNIKHLVHSYNHGCKNARLIHRSSYGLSKICNCNRIVSYTGQ